MKTVTNLLVLLATAGPSQFRSIQAQNSAAETSQTPGCQQIAVNLTSQVSVLLPDDQGCPERCRSQSQRIIYMIGLGSLHQGKSVTLSENEIKLEVVRLLQKKPKSGTVAFKFEPCLALNVWCLHGFEGFELATGKSLDTMGRLTHCAYSPDSCNIRHIGQFCYCQATLRLERVYRESVEFNNLGPFKCDPGCICARLSHLLGSTFKCSEHASIIPGIECRAPVKDLCLCSKDGRGHCTQVAWSQPQQTAWTQGSRISQINFDSSESKDTFGGTMNVYNEYLRLVMPDAFRERLDPQLINRIFRGQFTNLDRMEPATKRRRRENRLDETSIAYIQDSPSPEEGPSVSQSYQRIDTLNFAEASTFGSSEIELDVEFGSIELMPLQSYRQAEPTRTQVSLDHISPVTIDQLGTFDGASQAGFSQAGLDLDGYSTYTTIVSVTPHQPNLPTSGHSEPDLHQKLTDPDSTLDLLSRLKREFMADLALADKMQATLTDLNTILNDDTNEYYDLSSKNPSLTAVYSDFATLVEPWPRSTDPPVEDLQALPDYADEEVDDIIDGVWNYFL